MKSHTPSLHRPTTQRLSTRRRRYHYWPALALALLAALMVWAGAAAASCNFLSTVASIGSADGQVLTPRGIATDSARRERANWWARRIAKITRHLFQASPMPELQVPRKQEGASEHLQELS